VKRSNIVFWILGAAAVLYISTAPRFYVGCFQVDARDNLAARALFCLAAGWAVFLWPEETLLPFALRERQIL